MSVDFQQAGLSGAALRPSPRWRCCNARLGPRMGWHYLHVRPRYKHQIADNCTTSTWYLGPSFMAPIHQGTRAIFGLFLFGAQQARNLDQGWHHQRQFQTARCRTRIQIIARADEPKAIHYSQTGGLVITEYSTLDEYHKRGWNLRAIWITSGCRSFVIVKYVVGQRVAIMSQL